MTNTTKNEALSFNGLGIAPKLLNILTDLGFTTPTPIQIQSIPSSLQRKDLVGIAQTGTGKTLAFGIPMIQLLATHKGMGLVVLPTRELAIQVDDNLKKIGKKIGLRTAVIIGGEPINKQLATLKQKPHIIIATPGRLMDHTERKSINLGNVRVLVLDEADMMLDMGFLPQIKSILKLVPKERQTMLFSATMPSDIINIANQYMKLPTRIEVAPAGTSAENVEQEMIVIEKNSKFEHLKKILTQTKGTVLIFARTKHNVKNLTKKVAMLGFTAAEIHSNRSLAQRQVALGGFKTGKFRILIATDIAARGIDVNGIELVINYDLPEKTGDYVHRIGRTARAGKSGKAVSFVLPEQMKDVKEIEKLIKKSVKISRIAPNPNAPKDPIETRARRNNFSGNRGQAKRPFRARSIVSGSSLPKKEKAFPKTFSNSSQGQSNSTKYKSPSVNKFSRNNTNKKRTPNQTMARVINFRRD